MQTTLQLRMWLSVVRSLSPRGNSFGYWIKLARFLRWLRLLTLSTPPCWNLLNDGPIQFDVTMDLLLVLLLLGQSDFASLLCPGNLDVNDLSGFLPWLFDSYSYNMSLYLKKAGMWPMGKKPLAMDFGFPWNWLSPLLRRWSTFSFWVLPLVYFSAMLLDPLSLTTDIWALYPFSRLKLTSIAIGFRAR